MAIAKETILSVKNLRTHFLRRYRPPVKAVDGLSYTVRKGEMVAIVGESGCGKTMGALSLVRLNPPTSKVVGGEVIWQGQDLLKFSESGMRRVRGREIGVVFQNPLSSLNPLMTIADQMAEALKLHRGMSKTEGRDESKRVLETVSVPDVDSKMRAYPFELSGGMRQRVMVAMAICCNPQLLIADEPTTALDATTQGQILELIVAANDKDGRATILVTHDLGIVARYADTVHIMYAGRIVESAGCVELYSQPQHPYTEALLKAVPRFDSKIEYELSPIGGFPPRLDRLGEGCSFAPRCGKRLARCDKESPPFKTISENHSVACWRIDGG
ncbi:MAG TPA: ABC transporter ATP-binding protein [Syntrophorhabdaceae bacterium]|nr:ABC transporter ATP-binding protein [Syntrophorhabdaceae bacterium]